MRKVHETLAPYAKEDLDGTAEAMPVLGWLMQGRALGEQQWSEKKKATATHVWRPILPNSLAPGDVVRVKPGAYEGARSAMNGKTGRVSALRGGVIVNYDGEQGATMGDRHAPDKLERQVPIRRGVTK